MNLSSDELVSVALELERHGEALYSRIAMRFASVGVVETFKYLAKEERNHADAFSRILIGGKAPAAPALEPGEDMYITILAQSGFIRRFTEIHIGPGRFVRNNQ